MDKILERTIQILVLAILVFAPLATGAVRTLEFLVVQGLAIAAGFLWLLRVWLNPAARILFPPISWAVLAFVVYAVGQYYFADVEFVARMELIHVLVYALVFFIILNNTNRGESIHVLSLVLIFLALAISGYALYQFATNSQKIWHFAKPLQYTNRGSGTFINPNHLAAFLEMILPIALAYVLMGRFRHVTKIVLGYSCLVMLVAIGATGSRGGCVATVLMLVTFLLVLLKYREFRGKAAIMLALLSVAGLVFFANTTSSKRRFEKSFVGEKLEDARSIFWKTAIRMWQDYPWFGVGPGHYDLHCAQYRTADWQAQVRPIYAHNDYLNTLSDWGIFGLIIVLAAVTLLTVGLFRTWPNVQRSRRDLADKRSNRAAFIFGAAMGLLALLLHEIVEFNMQIPAIAILAVSLMALISWHRKFESETYWRQVNIFGKLTLTVFLGATLFYLAQQEIRRANEHIWLTRAEEITDSYADKISALKKAHEVEPKNLETTHQIGELLRAQSWEGNNDYATLAEEAIIWFQRGMELNPLDPYNFLRAGMCLDWIGKHDEAAAMFEKALKLDPNNYYLVAFQGWHFVQLENYAEAKKWFERSLEIFNNWKNRNHMAQTYLEIVNRKLAEAANAPANQ